MKSFYEVMLIISIMCMAGDSENFTVFLIWHLIWFVVLLFCGKKVTE